MSKRPGTLLLRSHQHLHHATNAPFKLELVPVAGLLHSVVLLRNEMFSFVSVCGVELWYEQAYREQSKGKPKAKKERRRKRAVPKRRAPEVGLTLGGWVSSSSDATLSFHRYWYYGGP